jgi:hypothetical protein
MQMVQCPIENAAVQHRRNIVVNTAYVNQFCALHQSLCRTAGRPGRSDYPGLAGEAPAKPSESINIPLTSIGEVKVLSTLLYFSFTYGQTNRLLLHFLVQIPP